MKLENKRTARGWDLALFVGNWTNVKILSEIKSPLVKFGHFEKGTNFEKIFHLKFDTTE